MLNFVAHPLSYKDVGGYSHVLNMIMTTLLVLLHSATAHKEKGQNIIIINFLKCHINCATSYNDHYKKTFQLTIGCN